MLANAAWMAVAVLALPIGAPTPASAHQDGCHRWHSCPSDTGSYVCGDLGYYTYCPVQPVPQTTPTADKDCADFASQQEAQDYFVSRGGPEQDPDGLDADSDGIVCEDRPCPCSSSPPAAEPDPPRTRERIGARITAVVDGDTIKVRTRRGRRLTVRLIGVDAPESGRRGTAAECGARKAAGHVTRLAFKRPRGSRRRVGRSVTLMTDPGQDRTDRYGRLLAYVKTDARKDLGREQLRAGWAAVFVFEREFERAGPYTHAESEARAARRGVWRLCGGDFHRTS